MDEKRHDGMTEETKTESWKTSVHYEWHPLFPEPDQDYLVLALIIEDIPIAETVNLFRTLGFLADAQRIQIGQNVGPDVLSIAFSNDLLQPKTDGQDYYAKHESGFYRETVVQDYYAKHEAEFLRETSTRFKEMAEALKQAGVDAQDIDNFLELFAPEKGGFRLDIPITFAPEPPKGVRFALIPEDKKEGASPVVLNLASYMDKTDLDAMLERLEKRNFALGIVVPDVLGKNTFDRAGLPTERTVGPNIIFQNLFRVAQGFFPMHRLSEKNRSGELFLFPEQRSRFYEMRTPLNTAVGLALFSRTLENAPGAWQEITLNDLVERVYCLTERGAYRRGNHRTDILTEVVKLFNEKNVYVTWNWERRGRAWDRKVTLGMERPIPNLELVYLDNLGRPVTPTQNTTLMSLAVPLELRGRRAYTPDGQDIMALPRDKGFRLDRIRWRWNPSFVDDLQAAPALDAKGNVKRDAKGNIMRGGYNIQVTARIFDALFRLRAEGAFIAHDLLVLLATDIYRTRDGTEKNRNLVEREAQRLYDLLGLNENKGHPKRREDMVAEAVYRLKQQDIGALLPGTDERPRPPSEKELASGRRKGPYYRLVRSALYTPPAALVSKAQAAVLRHGFYEAVAIEHRPGESHKTLILKNRPDLKDRLPRKEKTNRGPKGEQLTLPGMEPPPRPSIPSGADIRAARKAAGLNLRDFAVAIGENGPNFSTWSRYESGKPVRVEGIPADVWDRVRTFVKEHGKDKE